MLLNVSYMGTKRQLADDVADVIKTAPAGPLLDLFSGMCAVGKAVSSARPVWTNDAQVFASTAAQAFFKSKALPPKSDEIIDKIKPFYQKNLSSLEDRFATEAASEADALQSDDIEKISASENQCPNIATDKKFAAQRARLCLKPTTFPYRLFSISYSGAYFSLAQSISIDSLRYAFDKAISEKLINSEEHRWLTLALCQAISKVGNTTGHFAQHLTIKEQNKRRYIAQRTRSVWREWRIALDESGPIGNREWRQNNRVFNKNAETLIGELNDGLGTPSVVYADPPYTSDQYSRYYHIYETLILYDYPTSSGKGRYRPERFCSPFSLKSKVEQSLNTLVEGCANLRSTLVLSYPTDGLLPNSNEAILDILKRHYTSAEIVKEMPHFHSSLGASKGSEKHSVTEVLFAACV